MAQEPKHRMNLVAIVIIVIVVAGAAGYAWYRFSRRGSSSASSKEVVIGPSNPDTLVDIGTGGVITTPDALDPATGFYGVDSGVFQAVYQGLVTFNGSSLTHLVPVLAQ
ncbi:MAG: hypothetical protein ACP5SK_05580, partial [Thermoprotei archaeon]